MLVSKISFYENVKREKQKKIRTKNILCIHYKTTCNQQGKIDIDYFRRAIVIEVSRNSKRDHDSELFYHFDILNYYFKSWTFSTFTHCPCQWTFGWILCVWIYRSFLLHSFILFYFNIPTQIRATSERRLNALLRISFSSDSVMYQNNKSIFSKKTVSFL